MLWKAMLFSDGCDGHKVAVPILMSYMYLDVKALSSETVKVEHGAAPKQEPAKGNSGKEKTMNVAAWIFSWHWGDFAGFSLYIYSPLDPEIFRMLCLLGLFPGEFCNAPNCAEARESRSTQCSTEALCRPAWTDSVTWNGSTWTNGRMTEGVKHLVDSCLFDAQKKLGSGEAADIRDFSHWACLLLPCFLFTKYYCSTIACLRQQLVKDIQMLQKEEDGKFGSIFWQKSVELSLFRNSTWTAKTGML